MKRAAPSCLDLETNGEHGKCMNSSCIPALLTDALGLGCGAANSATLSSAAQVAIATARAPCVRRAGPSGGMPHLHTPKGGADEAGPESGSLRPTTRDQHSPGLT
jgi:hypothetical protein